MKTSILTLIASFLLSHPLFSAEVWGGKWDNRWLVFFIIDRNGENIKVAYKWQENSSQPLRSQNPTGKREGPVMTVGKSITLRLNGDKGLAYGAFAKPRLANLVKLKDGADIDNLDEQAIISAGWTKVPIDKEAFKKSVFEGMATE